MKYQRKQHRVPVQPKSLRHQRKRGGQPKLTKENIVEILAVVAITGSVNRAAQFVGVTEGAIRYRESLDRAFAASLKKAKMDRRLHSERQVRGASAWQAHAWFLERRYPKEFARKTIIEHQGRDGGPIQSESHAKVDVKDEREVAALMEKMTDAEAVKFFQDLARTEKK